jgi:hypothetical protein
MKNTNALYEFDIETKNRFQTGTNVYKRFENDYKYLITKSPYKPGVRL